MVQGGVKIFVQEKIQVCKKSGNFFKTPKFKIVKTLKKRVILIYFKTSVDGFYKNNVHPNNF